MIARHQPVTLATMERLFHTGNGAPLAILGQPDVAKSGTRQSNDHSARPELSYVSRLTAEVKGLDE
jgi:hypothetical protein